MGTVTIKISAQLQRELEQASRREKLSKSELTRRALTAYIAQRGQTPAVPSALDLAGDLVACFSGGPKDLASNPKYFADFGKA